ncbi:unnamed protein product [Effrenium voratum]|nr:unnamed protein product [Effrenium voratum]
MRSPMARRRVAAVTAVTAALYGGFCSQSFAVSGKARMGCARAQLAPLARHLDARPARVAWVGLQQSTRGVRTARRLFDSGSFFGVGVPEALVIALLGWFLLGPEELFKISKKVGGWLGELRSYIGQAARQYESALDDKSTRQAIEGLRQTQQTVSELAGSWRSVTDSLRDPLAISSTLQSTFDKYSPSQMQTAKASQRISKPPSLDLETEQEESANELEAKRAGDARLRARVRDMLRCSEMREAVRPQSACGLSEEHAAFQKRGVKQIGVRGRTGEEEGMLLTKPCWPYVLDPRAVRKYACAIYILNKRYTLVPQKLLPRFDRLLLVAFGAENNSCVGGAAPHPQQSCS